MSRLRANFRLSDITPIGGPTVSRHRLASALLATAVGGIAAACSLESGVPASPLQAQAIEADARTAGQSDIAALRRSLAPYHRLEVARESDWPTAITPCWYHGELGAMGYHYANPERIDLVLDPLRPEALIYEPLAGGKYKLVGAEFIVPIAAWTGTKPPELYGQAFSRVEDLGLYALHVWAESENPAGMFASWNPKVSCKYAAESVDRGLAH
jgi:hypothetical protein